MCMDLLHAKYKVSNDWLRTDPPKKFRPQGEQSSVLKSFLKKEHFISLVMVGQLMFGQISGSHG